MKYMLLSLFLMVGCSTTYTWETPSPTNQTGVIDTDSTSSTSTTGT
jgi:uncharacterized protein YcfL